MSGRTFAIGDIHGDLAALQTLFARLPQLVPGDTLVFLGDYVDRGPDSAGVVAWLREAWEVVPATLPVFGSVADIKHVFVVDDDIDVFDDGQIDWALATRFQADRDLMVASGFRAVPIDPSLAGSRTGARTVAGSRGPSRRTRAASGSAWLNHPVK